MAFEVRAATEAERPEVAQLIREMIPGVAADQRLAWLYERNPAGRALTWQSTDPAGTPIVRERNWITFQAGELRVCASCHGVNALDQAGRPAPRNPPQALRALLEWWKTRRRQ